MLVSATVLRAALYYNLKRIKHLGGCGGDKVTQESIGRGSLPTPQPPLQHGSHQVPEQCRGGEDGSGQAL